LSSREFNQDTGKAKKAAKHGPVFITDRGKPSLVLLAIEDYRKLTGAARNIVDRLSMGPEDELEFEPARLDGEIAAAADLP
jgi:prevent-host-death family protein